MPRCPHCKADVRVGPIIHTCAESRAAIEPHKSGSDQRLVRPWVGNLHHSRDLCDDWGFIRDESGKLIITVPVTVPHEEWAEHRRNNTDPTQPIVDAILAALNGPNSDYPEHISGEKPQNQNQ